jgi:hypothetical protein
MVGSGDVLAFGQPVTWQTVLLLLLLLLLLPASKLACETFALLVPASPELEVPVAANASPAVLAAAVQAAAAAAASVASRS